MAKQNSKKKRRILKAKIDFISLCPKGANTLSTVFKADDGSEKDVELTTLCKDMNEQGEIVAVVYAPEMEDSQGDIASAEVIKDFAYGYAQTSGGIDIRHNEDTLSKEDVFVAETMIVQKGDPRFSDIKDYSDNVVDVTGGWGVVIKVADEGLRELYRSGEWSGVSMGGMMLSKDISEEDTFFKKFKELFGILNDNKSKNVNKTEKDMALSEQDKKDMVELVTKTMNELDAKKAKIAKEAAEKIVKEKKDEPKLGLGLIKPTLKSSSDEDILRFRKDTEIFNLSEKVDKEDVISVIDFQKAAKEIALSDNLDEIVKKQAGVSYESFYKTNQTTSEVKRASNVENDNDGGISELINKQLDEEEKAAKAGKQ